jgi:hypothetical protein
VCVCPAIILTMKIFILIDWDGYQQVGITRSPP